jgi:hypothetical protein
VVLLALLEHRHEGERLVRWVAMPKHDRRSNSGARTRAG